MVYCQLEIARNKANLAISVLLCRRKSNLDSCLILNLEMKMNLLKCFETKERQETNQEEDPEAQHTPPGGKAK
jgi:hypothetical protein